MAKARSPAYPVVGLRQAVAHVSDIYRKDYQNSIPREVAARHMGYQGLNGQSLGVLSALKKYGLIEGRGDKTRVSDLAVTILAQAPGSVERFTALEVAATSPDLFVELIQRSQAGRVSDEAVRAYLLTQRFLPAAADTALRSYRETIEFIESEGTHPPRVPGTIAMVAPSAQMRILGGPQPGNIAMVAPSAQMRILGGRQPGTIESRLSGFSSGNVSSPPTSESVPESADPSSAEPLPVEFQLSISGDRVTVDASLTTQEALDALIDRLAALKKFLPEKKG